jgi:choline dehydrogenase
VSRLLIENCRAVGVQCAERRLYARQEVIVCAGAIGSPAVLLRSGIGPSGYVLDLPGVGEKFQDHLVASQSWDAHVATVNTLGPVALLVGSGVGIYGGPLQRFAVESFAGDELRDRLAV